MDQVGSFEALLFDGLGVAALGIIASCFAGAWQFAREYLAEKRRARTAARVLRGDYKMWQYAIASAAETGRWWAPLDVFPTHSTFEDVRALAERRRNFGDWASVGSADRALRRLAARRSIWTRPNPDELRDVFGHLERARKQLSKFDHRNFIPHECAEQFDSGAEM